MHFYKGDTFSFDFGTTFEDGSTYTFQVGDIVKIGVKAKESQSKYELFKEIQIKEAIDNLTICFTHKETKRCGVGNKILEIELTQADGTVRTIYQEKITVKGDVINE